MSQDCEEKAQTVPETSKSLASLPKILMSLSNHRLGRHWIFFHEPILFKTILNLHYLSSQPQKWIKFISLEWYLASDQKLYQLVWSGTLLTRMASKLGSFWLFQKKEIHSQTRTICSLQGYYCDCVSGFRWI